MSWKMSLRLTSQPEALRVARKFASSAARAEGASVSDCVDIEVALGEALTNAHQHAYGGKPGPLKLLLEFDGLRIVITLSDNGSAVTEKPAVPARLPPPGESRGLYLIGQLMDEVTIIAARPRGRGVAIRMAKRIR